MAVYSQPGFLIYRGRPVLQSTQIDYKQDGNNKPVMTLLLGMAGHTPGPTTVELTFSNAIPADGPEVDWKAVELAKAEIPLTFKMANQSVNLVGMVMSVSASTQTEGTPNKLDVTYSARVVSV